MRTPFKSAALFAVVASFGLASTAQAQLEITEILYNTSTGTETNWEYIEIRNAGATPITFDGGFVGSIDEEYTSTFNPNIIADPSGGDQPVTDLTIAPNGVAVLYEGFATAWDQQVFRDAWGLPSTTQLIPMQFRFAPFLTNGGESFGIWQDRASFELDHLPNPDTESTRESVVGSYTNSLATVDYTDASPWPSNPADGVSIQFTGTGDYQDGANWYAHDVVGAPGTLTSTALTESGGALNSASDFGSPGVTFGTPGVGAPGVIISEIMYNPNSTESGTTAWEWVEIYNNTGSAIDFSDPGTTYFFDDDDGGEVAEAELTVGLIPVGGTAVIYDAEDNNLADMQAAWGAGINFIPSDAFPGFSNSGDGIGIWDDATDYSTDKTADDFANADSVVIYSDSDVDGDPMTLEDNWPVDNGAASIYLSDLSADQTIGANWSIGDDFDGFTATEVTGDVTIHPGGDIGSPGSFTAFTPVATGLDGDFNDDGTVDAADYTVYRDNLGLDSAALNGNGTGGALVTTADYDVWVLNYGTSSSSASSAAVPEPTTALLLLAGVTGLLARRNG